MAAAYWGSGNLQPAEAQVLEVHVLLDAVHRAFPADATIFDAAKRRYFLKQIGRSVAAVNFLPPLPMGA